MAALEQDAERQAEGVRRQGRRPDNVASPCNLDALNWEPMS